MHWFWRVRIYNKCGDYCHGEIKTKRDFQEIITIQDFYCELTGCKMLIEGMNETPAVPRIFSIGEAYNLLHGKN